MTMASLRELQLQADSGYGRVQEALEEAGDKPIALPRPLPQDDEALHVYRHAGFVNHANDQIFKIRCWQAEKMGFPPVTLEEVACQMAVDMPPCLEVVRIDDGQRQLEWYYDISADKEYRPGRHGGAKKMMQSRIRRVRHTEEHLLWLFPYRQEHVVWEMWHRPVDELVAPIPLGVVLRMEEIKRAKLFSSFSVIAPAALFRRTLPDRLDPVLLGAVARSPIEGCVPSNEGVRHFVVARWDHATKAKGGEENQGQSGLTEAS